jgi:two-component system heavy metal sensor histidine kinase CusS
MFWLRRGKSWSLAQRLSIWYAVSAFLLLAIATGLLYWGTVHRFNQENDQYLEKKISTLEDLLRDPSQQMGTVRWEVAEESLTSPSVRVLSRVASADGHILLETSGMSRELPDEALAGHPADRRGANLRTPSGKEFRVLTSTVASSASGNPGFRLQVAIDLDYEHRLLRSYLDQLWLVLGIGLLAAVIIGFRIARSGIAPVRSMTETVKRVQSSTLSERVALAGMPSELAVLAETFNEMLERLEEAFTRLSRFSSDLAHELRTPIGNIRGELEVALIRARAPHEYREIMQSSLEECGKLSRLIDRLLFLARSEHPEAQVHREELNIDQELQTVVDFYEAAASDRRIHLEVQTPTGLTASVDRTLFQLAVGNLVENAVRHTPPEGNVRVEAGSESSALIVRVTDTGEGIAPEHLPHVFERFYRADPARSHNGGGAGLGLALVQTIARLHKGNASIDSTSGRGTAVTLTFAASIER